MTDENASWIVEKRQKLFALRDRLFREVEALRSRIEGVQMAIDILEEADRRDARGRE